MPQWLPIHYPRALGPVFSADIRKDYQSSIEKQKPQVLLLGNSVINSGIDESQFELLTSQKMLKYSFPGTASAYWYLLVKSNIATAETPPKYLLVFFLDNLLTTPDLGANSTYQPMIDEIAGENETVLLQKAYLNQLDPVEGYLDSHYPLFGERQTLKDKIDNRLKYTLPQLFQNCAKPCLDKALDAVFDEKNMLPNVLQQNAINLGRWSSNEWDFNALVEKSFIPDMIQITREKGIKLIFVREKNARVMTLEDESKDMRKYFQDISDYLKKEGVPLLDFAHNSALTLEMFLDEMHLNPQGRLVFTRLVAEGFLTLLK
ncbi:MAG: hypothetical protein Q7W56_06695 [Candidatus Latescibacteria bacterium]|nr:hypothetical protein [Candidatus Latescibacterota bacterium]